MLPCVDLMTFNLGFQTKCNQNPRSSLTLQRSYQCFEILFKVRWVHCGASFKYVSVPLYYSWSSFKRNLCKNLPKFNGSSPFNLSRSLKTIQYLKYYDYDGFILENHFLKLFVYLLAMAKIICGMKQD